jgi:hypothetical protein
MMSASPAHAGVADKATIADKTALAVRTLLKMCITPSRWFLFLPG